MLILIFISYLYVISVYNIILGITLLQLHCTDSDTGKLEAIYLLPRKLFMK